MTAADAPTKYDRRQIGALALASTIVLGVIGCLNLFVASALAPRVNVRWAESINDTERAQHESRLKLLAGEHLEGLTWAYDLGDSSPETVEAIVNDPSVEDTHHIDRSLRVVSSDAPRGTTRVHGGLSSWRDAPVVPWLTRLASSYLILSALWLATIGRPRRSVAAR